MKHRIRINGEVKEMGFDLYSGFHDDNDREIFEGDLLKIVFEDDSTDAGKVTFSHGRFWVLDEPLDDVLYSCEVTVID